MLMPTYQMTSPSSKAMTNLKEIPSKSSYNTALTDDMIIGVTHRNTRRPCAIRLMANLLLCVTIVSGAGRNGVHPNVAPAPLTSDDGPALESGDATASSQLPGLRRSKCMTDIEFTTQLKVMLPNTPEEIDGDVDLVRAILGTMRTLVVQYHRMHSLGYETVSGKSGDKKELKNDTQYMKYSYKKMHKLMAMFHNNNALSNPPGRYKHVTKAMKTWKLAKMITNVAVGIIYVSAGNWCISAHIVKNTKGIFRNKFKQVRDTVKEMGFTVKSAKGLSKEIKPYCNPSKKWKWWKDFTQDKKPEKYIEKVIKGLDEKMPRIKIEGLTDDERTAFKTIWIELVRIFCKEQTILTGAPGTKGEDGNSRNPKTE